MPNSGWFTSIPGALDSECKRKRDSIELDCKKLNIKMRNIIDITRNMIRIQSKVNIKV